MSKVLKIVAVVASIGAAVVTAGASLGISAALLSGISVAASIGASLLAPRPKAVDASRENIDRLRANLDPRTPRKTVIGYTAMATDIRDEEFTDDQTYFHRFIVVAAHKVQSIAEIWFDDELAWTAAGGPQGKFSGYLQVATRLEGTAGNAINISSRMGSTRRFTGCAYVHLRYKLTGNSKKAESPFAQSITTRITIRGKGAELYDPRQDSTVPGGSGTQRADDQTTWVWSDDASRNPALALLFYLLGYRINGRISVGKGIPPARIDLESFITAANICDETVAKVGGGTEPRYRSDGMWSEGDSPETVISQLKASMNADLDDVNGKYRVFIFHNDLALPVASFDDSDVLEEFDWNKGPSLEQNYNIVRGAYTDASNESLYQLVDYPPIEETSLDGIDRAEQVDLPLVQSVSQAQRLIALRYRRQKHGGGTFLAEFGPRAWACEKNSVVELSFVPRGFTSKLFRVADMTYRDDGVVPLMLREESALIYEEPTLQEGLALVPSTPYDPSKNPVIQAVLGGAATLTAKSVAYPLSGTDNSVSVAAFTGTTAGGQTIAFPADTLGSLASGVRYVILWSLETSDYEAVVSPATAQMADSDYVFIGSQSTSDGGTYTPPPDPPPGGGNDGTHPY